jgi:hypothetical protein
MVDTGRTQAIDADETESSQHPVRTKQLGQTLGVPESVLQRQDAGGFV